MLLVMRIGRYVNALLTRFGYKILIFDRNTGRTFPERQLLRALSELSALYNARVFEKELILDNEELKFLSNSMYTGFGTGLNLVEYLRQSLGCEGVVCEFGVAQGAISALLGHEIKKYPEEDLALRFVRRSFKAFGEGCPDT